MKHNLKKRYDNIRKAELKLEASMKNEYLNQDCIIVKSRKIGHSIFTKTFPSGIFGRIIEVKLNGNLLVRTYQKNKFSDKIIRHPHVHTHINNIELKK